jgi:hypothetical protein
MKRIMLLLVVLLVPLLALSQGVYHGTTFIKSDTTLVKTTWDSISIPGPTQYATYLFVKNQGARFLFVALENDTSVSKRVTLRPGESYYWDHGIINRKYLRTRAQADSTWRYIFLNY